MKKHNRHNGYLKAPRAHSRMQDAFQADVRELNELSEGDKETLQSDVASNFAFVFSESVESNPLLRFIIDQRIQRGIESYGERLRCHNGRNPKVDCLEEIADAILYCNQIAMRIKPATESFDAINAVQMLIECFNKVAKIG